MRSVKPCGRSSGSGTFSRERDRARSTTTGCSEPSGVSVSASSAADAEADEVRRRRQVRLVGDAAARVVADRARVQPRAQVVRRGRARRGRRRRRPRSGGGRPGRRAPRPRTARSDCDDERVTALAASWAAPGSFSKVAEEGSEHANARAGRAAGVHLSLRTGEHVQAHVVDDSGRPTRRARRRRTRRGRRAALEVRAEHDGREVLVRIVGGDRATADATSTRR